MNSDKKDCYTCIYKGNVTGSAHSCCQHPTVKGVEGLLTLKAAVGLGSTNPLGLDITLIQENEETKTVPVQDWDETGIRKGYVLFPFNFDPTWLKHCLLHTSKEQ